MTIIRPIGRATGLEVTDKGLEISAKFLKPLVI